MDLGAAPLSVGVCLSLDLLGWLVCVVMGPATTGDPDVSGSNRLSVCLSVCRHDVRSQSTTQKQEARTKCRNKRERDGRIQRKTSSKQRDDDNNQTAKHHALAAGLPYSNERSQRKAALTPENKFIRVGVVDCCYSQRTSERKRKRKRK